MDLRDTLIKYAYTKSSSAQNSQEESPYDNGYSAGMQEVCNELIDLLIPEETQDVEPGKE